MIEKEFIPYSQAKTLKKLGFNEQCLGYYSLFEYSYPIDKYGVSGVVKPGKFIDIDTFKYLECLFGDKFKYVTTPTYSQVFKWFRIEHGLYSSINPKKLFPDSRVTGVEWNVNICGGDGNEIGPSGTYTYDKAQVECLKKLIDIVKTSPKLKKNDVS